MNYDEQVRKILKNSMDKLTSEYENAIIDFFGSPEEALKRMHLFVFEERTSPGVSSIFNRDEFATYSIMFEYHIRIKTEEELLKDRADEILRNRVPLDNCVTCRAPIYRVDAYQRTMHGLYHEACLDGRDSEDSNHY